MHYFQPWQPFLKILLIFHKYKDKNKASFISQFTLSGDKTLSVRSLSQKSVKYFWGNMKNAQKHYQKESLQWQEDMILKKIKP
ncbi:hypothetical protein MTBBW1_80007 [Desulfamplus magnetovallimortis]|uniref:Uncharacterized protein n=1 Tax=Desulfamplus magnetovallimortis TaxID=1246637 RepID=L0R3Q7_9BACT|nr:hypothetical protein DEMABW1_80007 [Desulfamplus magnetovallimortis BW-1]SLM32669.1 hypothetical protein MTBBW1_80007 [Desulfamplus magnetovallimortis]